MLLLLLLRYRTGYLSDDPSWLKDAEDRPTVSQWILIMCCKLQRWMLTCCLPTLMFVVHVRHAAEDASGRFAYGVLGGDFSGGQG